MCTALNLKTKDNKHLFGRNLDVIESYGQSVIIVPRKFQWNNVVENRTEVSKYACVGMGIVVENHPLLFDGVNEKGLAGAGLNFTNFAVFDEKAISGKTNFSGSDFLYWVLSSFENLEDLKIALKDVVLTNTSVKPGYDVAKLHWIFTDLSGKSIVIEYLKDGMHVYENEVGVLTNDPTFDWQITNLSQYVTIDTKTPKPKQMGDILIKPYGHGLNMLGLPGDASPASRFVRTNFFKWSVFGLENEISGVSDFFNVLNSVFVVKGTEIDDNGEMNYTLYQSCMCQESGVYYYRNYNNSRINAVSLFNEDLEGKEIIKFDYKNEQDIFIHN